MAPSNTAIEPDIYPGINSGDRLGFTLFLALVLHTILILGIGFDLYRETNRSPIIEVTLAQTPDQDSPDKADYIAQDNQAGGGDLIEKNMPSVTSPTEFFAEQAAETIPESPPEQTRSSREKTLTRVTTQKESSRKVPNISQEPEDTEVLQDLEKEISLLERSLELASLDARLDVRKELNTRKTRVKRVSSVATLKTADAYYVKQWIKKIHRVGRLNYPEEARRRRIFGDLRLTVSLYANGQVKDIHVLRSSGHKILDDAAIRIVRLAAPFAPFPKQLKAEYDVLEITRTWLFSKDGHTPVL